jgi:hypothetical protein
MESWSTWYTRQRRQCLRIYLPFSACFQSSIHLSRAPHHLLTNMLSTAWLPTRRQNSHMCDVDWKFSKPGGRTSTRLWITSQMRYFRLRCWSNQVGISEPSRRHYESQGVRESAHRDSRGRDLLSRDTNRRAERRADWAPGLRSTVPSLPDCQNSETQPKSVSRKG